MTHEYLRLAAHSILSMTTGAIGVATAMYFVGSNLFAFMGFSIIGIAVMLSSARLMTCARSRNDN